MGWMLTAAFLLICLVLRCQCVSEVPDSVIIKDKNKGIVSVTYMVPVEGDEADQGNNAMRMDGEEGIPPPVSRILGGQRASIEAFPFTVSLQAFITPRNSWFFVCTGSLIKPNMVLTAAHCLDIFKEYPMRVQLGADTIFRQNGSVIINVSDTLRFQHPFYASNRRINIRRGTYAHDVGILQLEQNATLSERIQTIDLATIEPPPGTLCSVAGFGLRGPGLVGQLFVKPDRILNRKECAKAFSPYSDIYIRELHLCGSFPDTITCRGDSGSALVCGGKVAGVVSWGPQPCILHKEPYVQANVVHDLKYLKYILSPKRH